MMEPATAVAISSGKIPGQDCRYFDGDAHYGQASFSNALTRPPASCFLRRLGFPAEIAKTRSLRTLPDLASFFPITPE